MSQERNNNPLNWFILNFAIISFVVFFNFTSIWCVEKPRNFEITNFTFFCETTFVCFWQISQKKNRISSHLDVLVNCSTPNIVTELWPISVLDLFLSITLYDGMSQSSLLEQNCLSMKHTEMICVRDKWLGKEEGAHPQYPTSPHLTAPHRTRWV